MTIRNHRKLLIVDSQLAFIGGVNIADEWLPKAEGGAGWRDDMARVCGPVLRDLCESFAACWREACDEELKIRPVQTSPCGEVQAAVLAQAGYAEKRQALEAYVRRIWQAREQVWIANAYFLPDLRLRRALVGATRRGVDVRIVLPAHSDVELVRHASRAIWGRLLYAGVRIFEYLPSMLHSKTAVIDQQWVTLGSFNLDTISIRNNRELNLSVLNEDFAAKVAESMRMDQEHCREVTHNEYRNRSLSDRAAERALYWFRRWL